MTSPSRSILYLVRQESANMAARLDGIRRAAADLGLRVDKVLCPPAPSAAVLRGLIGFWQAAVCIVECAGEDTVPAPRLFGRTPVLYVDCDPALLPASASCLYCAGTETADLAARTLLRANAAAYAYVEPSGDFYWSRARARRFEEILRLNGKAVTRLRSLRRKLVVSIRSIRALASAFRKLPKPIGVFAANDFVAEEVFAAARLARLEIPGDLAVIGVDDNAEICEHASPPLTSIRLDFRRSGEKAAEMAAELLKSRRRHALRATYDALGLVPRGSCPTAHAGGHSRAILAALNYIRDHLGERISIPDVVRAMGCPRRTAELRFRAACGNSILGEIRAQRLERARVLASLRPELSLDAIAREVGYANRSTLWKLTKVRRPNHSR